MAPFTDRGTGPEGRSAGAWLRTAFYVLASAICYYGATQVAWMLCFPNSKVSLFFPPHAVLISILLFVPTRRWWIYTLAAASAHFLATQQAQWPVSYALQCEVFDAVQNVGTAAAIRRLIKSPITAITLHDAILFVLIAVVLVPFGTAFWGASFTVAYGFGAHYWIEWRNLGISNAVTAVVLIPAFLLGAHQLTVARPGMYPRGSCWKPLSSVRPCWRWESSCSIERRQVPARRPRCYIRRFLCSSGRRSASASAASARRC